MATAPVPSAPKTTPPLRARRRDKPRGWLSDNVKWMLGTLAMPVALTVISVGLNMAANERARIQKEEADGRSRAELQQREDLARAENRSRLYTEMLAKREEADAAVRQGVFDKVMGSYLSPTHGDLQSKTVALELLALNFHDAVNLSPLFWQLDREVSAGPDAQRPWLQSELQRIALEIKNRQVALLMPDEHPRPVLVDLRRVVAGGDTFDITVRLNDPAAPTGLGERSRRFKVDVIGTSPAQRRLQVQVEELRSDFDAAAEQQRRFWEFWVDPYDFPLVNFTRLSRDERFAVILDAYQHGAATLRFLYFPSSRGGSKDKPYIEDVWAAMRGPAGELNAPLAPPGAGPVTLAPPGAGPATLAPPGAGAMAAASAPGATAAAAPR